MSADCCHEIAAHLLAARQNKVRLDPAKISCAPENTDDCYRIQQMVVDALGPVAAFKTGRKAAGDTPIMAPILAETVRPAGAVFERHELSVIGIELEIGFQVDGPIPDPAAPGFAAAVREFVAPLPVIEVVDTRLADPDASGDLWELADNQINGGLVYGTPLADWQDVDLSGGEISLTAGEKTIFAGRGHVPGGSAFDIFCAFATMVGSHCGGLRPAQIVTTGSLTGLIYIDPGQPVQGTIEGLGTVTVSFS